MNETNKIYQELEILYEAMKIAKEGLRAIAEHDMIAQKTLAEIDKIVEKISQL
jgi:DNA-directed RNA polymerase subunit H (RpoH/RPB5)|tara:strand:+ start:346 stop:504 length:159 start_codon:yes stop_codon:yes gene_type:complete